MRKKHSLVLNNEAGHHGEMNTNQKTPRSRRFRTLVRHVWGDQIAAHRAMLPPYDDYLINRRGGH